MLPTQHTSTNNDEPGVIMQLTIPGSLPDFLVFVCLGNHLHKHIWKVGQELDHNKQSKWKWTSYVMLALTGAESPQQRCLCQSYQRTSLRDNRALWGLCKKIRKYLATGSNAQVWMKLKIIISLRALVVLLLTKGLREEGERALL